MPAFAYDLFAPHKTVKRAPNGGCQLYKAPKMGATLNSSTPITFEWDPSCLGDTRYIDIALLSARGALFHWRSVPAASGKHECQLDAGWWDQQNAVQVQLGITASDEPLALSPFPAGPVFTARNSDPIPTVSTSSHPSVSGTRTSSTPAPTGNYAGAGGVVNVQQLYSDQQAQHRGRLAASIILPLLVAVLVSVGGYIWYSRRREAKRRQQWVETIDKRMSRASADWQSMSALGGRPSMQSGRSRTMSHLGGAAHGRSSLAPENTRPSIYERFKSSTSDVENEKDVFAAEDLSQLGPRARALSAAAAEGRPLSELYKDLPAPPAASAAGVTRARSKSIAHDGSGLRTSGFLPRPTYDRAPASHARTTSTTSNNPYASAMAQRDSQAIEDKALYAFPTSSSGNVHSGASPVQRSRLDSSNSGPTPRTRLDSANGRGRVTSRVSFADTPRPSERRWNHVDEKSTVGRVSVGDSFAVDFDSIPALALMRVKSGEGLEGIAPDSPFTPTRDFIPGSKDDHSNSRHGNGTGVSGRTPDEMLKAYAAAMAGEKGELGQEMEMGAARGQMRPRQGEDGGLFSSVRKLWRK